MKSKKSNNKLFYAGLVIASALLSSCNRGAGEGCPISYNDVRPILDILGL